MLSAEDLKTYLGDGVAKLQVWGCHIPTPRVLTIGSRPQRPFQPQRLMVSDAADWIIHDLRIDGRSQFLSGPVPAEALSKLDLSFETLRVGALVQLDIEYIGSAILEGRSLYANLWGPAASGRAHAAFTSAPLRPTDPTRIIIDLGERALVFLQRREELFLEAALDERAKIDEALTGIRKIVRQAIMVSLHTHGDSILYGIDERTGAVLFELGGTYGPRCELDGYTPPWWKIVSDDCVSTAGIEPAT